MPSSVQTVALLVLVVAAGCAGAPTPAAETSATTTAEPTTTDSTTTTTRCYYRSFEVTAEPVTPADVARELATAPERLRYDARQVVTAAMANGSATRTTLDDAAFDGGEYVRANGTVYRVDRTTVSAEAVTADVFDLEGPLDAERDADEYERAEREAVAAENLSPTDREAFLAGLPGGERLDHLVSGRASLSAGYHYAYPNESARNASHLLADEPRYVAYRDTYWRVAFTDDRRTTQRATYRYSLNRTADSLAAFGDAAVAEYAVDANGTFADAERDLLVRAFDGERVTWSGCGESPPAGYQALFESVGSIPPNSHVAFVEHRGTLYRVTVLQAVE